MMPHPIHRPIVQARSLKMTDGLLVVCLILASFFALDPFVINLDKYPGIKHVPFVMTFLVTALALIGGKIFQDPQGEGRSHPWGPLLALSLWITCGSIYARFGKNVEETYLIMGAYMLLAPVYGWWIKNQTSARKIILSLYFSIAIFILAGAMWQAIQLRQWSHFHEEEFLTVPWAVYLYFSAQTKAKKVLAGFALLVLTGLVIKNTSFLVAALAVMYVFGIEFKRAAPRLIAIKKILVIYSAILGITIAVSLLALIKMMSPAWVPDGNPKYRLYTYEIAFEKFASSPFWGNLFTGPAAEKFGLFQVYASTQILPSHSDLLDLLANGGVLAITLFLMAAVVVVRRLYSLIRTTENLPPQDAGIFHWLAFSCLCAPVVYAFNPIMSQPGKAYVMWSQLGMLVGFLTSVKRTNEKPK